MTTFPALQPTTRTYTPGQHPNSLLGVLSGDEVSVRHTNGSTGNILSLTFDLISRAEQYDVISHYSLHGRFVPFDLDATTLIASGIEIPTGYQWIYTGSPTVDETCSIINVSVELELIPPINLLSPSAPSVRPCSTTVDSGGQGNFSTSFNLGSSTGFFDFTYETYEIADQFVISGAASYDTGMISTTGPVTVSVQKTSASQVVTVTVYAPLPGTAWKYTIGCVS